MAIKLFFLKLFHTQELSFNILEFLCCSLRPQLKRLSLSHSVFFLFFEKCNLIVLVLNVIFLSCIEYFLFTWLFFQLILTHKTLKLLVVTTLLLLLQLLLDIDKFFLEFLLHSHLIAQFVIVLCLLGHILCFHSDFILLPELSYNLAQPITLLFVGVELSLKVFILQLVGLVDVIGYRFFGNSVNRR